MYRYILVFVALVMGATVAAEQREGYVLKAGEGEEAAGAIIKASPSTGTQGGVLMLEPFPDGFSTGLHYHVNADEFFYVLSGTGKAVLGSEAHDVGQGDVIFIPARQDHKLFTVGSEMEVLVFLDKPGLEDEFRAWHREYGGSQAPAESVERLNEIAEQYGTVYKTLR